MSGRFPFTTIDTVIYTNASYGGSISRTMGVDRAYIFITEYRLVIVCSKEYEDKSQMITRLHLYRRPDVPKVDETDCMKYLLSHFKTKDDKSCEMASMADPEMLVLNHKLSLWYYTIEIQYKITEMAYQLSILVMLYV